MKRFVVLLSLLSLSVGATAQPYGLILFTNDNSSLVTNGLTGMPATFTNSIKVALYIGPDGVTDETSLVVVTSGVPVGIIAPGKYNGGSRTVAPYNVSNYVTIQVRAYESTYGSNYDAAIAAPPMNGRRAMVGKSPLTRLFLTASSPGPNTPKVGPLVGPITVFPVDGPPVVSANDIAVSEGSNGTATATFTIRLLAPATNEVSVDFATSDGSALAGSDYVATNGTVVFAVGETSKAVPVTLLPDATSESEETFNLLLSNPVNATLLRTTIVCTVVEVRITAMSVDTLITFNTLSGRRYVLEKSNDGVNWAAVAGASNILASGSSLTLTDHGSGCAGMNLYRAALIQQ
jgi:hypothetical protein